MERKESQIRARERAFRLIPKYIEEGFKIVPPNRYAEWAEFVVRNIKSFSLVEYVLDTMKALQRGVSFEEANNILDNPSQSGATYNMCLWQLAKFQKDGVNFMRKYYDFIDDEVKTELTKIEKENMEHIYPTEDQEKVAKYISEGLKYIYPERYQEWVNFIDKNMQPLREEDYDKYEYVIKIMQSLDRGDSFEEAEKLFKGISLVIYDSCCLNIAKFAKRGVDFVKNIKGLNYYNMKDILFSVWVDKLEIENDIYEELDELRKMEQNAKFMYQDIENERE